MTTFALVTVVVCTVSTLFAAILILRSGPLLDGLGRNGLLWMDHEQDLPPEDQVSEDERDLPLPKRALRGRLE